MHYVWNIEQGLRDAQQNWQPRFLRKLGVEESSERDMARAMRPTVVQPIQLLLLIREI
jgi:hypothetical protein